MFLFSQNRVSGYFSRISIGIIVGLSFSWPGMAKTEHAFDLLLRQTLEDNPAVRAAMAQAIAAQEDVKLAERGRWASVQLTGEANTPNALSGSNASLVVEQPVWTAGVITARIAESRGQLELNRSQLDVTRVQTALRLVDAWQSLMDASASVRVHEQSLVLYDRYESMMRRRVANKVSAAIELELLAARTVQARMDADEARSAERAALTRLEQILGQTISSNFREGLTSSRENDLHQPWLKSAALERLMDRIDEHPAVLRSRHETVVAQERIRQQQAQAWPQVVIRYKRQFQGALPTAGTDRDQVGLALNYTPGAGFSSMARVAADAQRLTGYELSTEAVTRDIGEQLRVDWENLRRDAERQTYQVRAIQSGREVLESYERQFVAGRKSWLDVLNALRELTQSEIRLVQAQSATSAGIYRLRLRAGVLPGHALWEAQP